MHSVIVVAHGPGWDQSGPWDGEWWWVGRLVMLLLFVVLIALTVWWVRRSTLRSQPSGIETARGILAERFARGEIETDEYHERLRQLDS
ncbi:MAG TPA: SHOCT domain-containing protein [Thermomicrobiales bacterium]|nr:SHOCT domain-containing protein [Thermomicrobiales bacterium]